MADRGYGWDHKKMRAELVAQLERDGYLICWRCGEPIYPGNGWHVGHDDHDRSIRHGPEHALCNLRAAGLKSQGKLSPIKASRNWWA